MRSFSRARSEFIINELRLIDWKCNHNKVINTSYVFYIIAIYRVSLQSGKDRAEGSDYATVIKEASQENGKIYVEIWWKCF